MACYSNKKKEYSFLILLKKYRKGVCVGEKEETFIKLNNFHAMVAVKCSTVGIVENIYGFTVH